MPYDSHMSVWVVWEKGVSGRGTRGYEVGRFPYGGAGKGRV